MLAVPARAIVDGDAKVRVIAAASILATAARDAEMRRLHGRFPQYGFDVHKGYPTPQHLLALRRYGVCEVYRRSFAPVREIGEQPSQSFPLRGGAKQRLAGRREALQARVIGRLEGRAAYLARERALVG